MKRLSSLVLLTSLTCVACSNNERPTDPLATVEIIEPVEGALLSTTRVRLKGLAQNTREVSINGDVFSVVGGAWEAPIDVPEGEVTVEVKVKGGADTVTFKVDASPPALVVTSPPRGLMHDSALGDTVTVAGTVSDSGLGLSLIKVDETIITPDAQGNFTHEYLLKEGSNTIAVTAIDKAQNESQSLYGVIHGPLTDPVSSIDPGININVSRQTIKVATEVISQVITPARVSQILETRLATNENITIQSITFDPIELDAVPKSDPFDNKGEGFIDFAMTVRNVVIKGDFLLLGETFTLTVTVDEADIDTSMFLRPDGLGGVEIEFGVATLDLKDGIDWTVEAGGATLDSDEQRFLDNLVEDIATIAFSELLGEQILSELYDPAVLNRRVELFGRVLEFSLYMEQIIIGDRGIFLRASLTMPADAFEDVPDVPGALNRALGESRAPSLQQGIVATSNRTALDRLFHGVWRSGLLHQTLLGDDFAGQTLPFELNAGALALLIDGRIANRVDTTSAVGIALRPMLPPVVELVPNAEGTGLVVELPEFHIDLLLDIESPTPQKLVTISTFLTLGVNLDINGTELKLDFETSLRADVADEPLFDLDDQKVENLLVDLVRLIPSVISNQLSLQGEADISWITLTNPEVEIHGSAKDQFSIGLDVEANPDALVEPATP